MPDPENTCIGRIYRGHRSIFTTEGRIEERVSLKLLKRKSCPGCKHCGWEEELISEYVANCDFDMNHIEDGKLYKVAVVNVTKDWETGYVDDYELEAVEVKDVK